MIVCAALLVETDSEKPYPFNYTVVPCLRHSGGYSILKDLCPDKRLHQNAVEGFIDNNGNFLTREEAYEEAAKCGQLPAELRRVKRERGENMLFSEDLY